jgi:hypothetical protein
VGARRSDIIVQFLTEAAVLTALGGLAGMFLGWLTSLGSRLVFPDLPTCVPLWAAVMGIAVSVGVGLLFGIWSAAKAARVESGRAHSFFREELSGLSRAAIYTRCLTHPAPPISGGLYVRERRSFGKDEDHDAVLFTDGNGCQITFRGARPLPQETVDRHQESTLHKVFYILRQRLPEPGLIFESLDTARRGRNSVLRSPARVRRRVG